MSTTTLTIPLLRLQNSKTTAAISSHLSQNPLFLKLSTHERILTQTRDDEDKQKLIQGIELAISKNVLSKLPTTHYKPIYVDGKSPSTIVEEIQSSCPTLHSGKSTVIVLCGLSGTGKGTTVSQLRSDLTTESPTRPVVCWSNGNIFRSVTLLTATWCEKNDTPLEEALARPSLLRDFMDMLTFTRIDGKWDTVISGLGLDTRVSLVENTLLKSTMVSKNIPTVARETQGEVVKFAAAAIEKMTTEEENMVVLLEGRSPTVDYVVTDYRFELKLEDESVIGKRRAAQRLMGGVLGKIEGEEGDVEKILTEELERMVAEIGSREC